MRRPIPRSGADTRVPRRKWRLSRAELELLGLAVLLLVFLAGVVAIRTALFGGPN